MDMNTIPDFKDVISNLELPEWLNGKEATCSYIKEGKYEISILMETCRCLQSLYDVICSARLNLSCACRKVYPELIDSNNPQISHVWMMSQFVNNAILWYCASFELLLQPFWLYYKIYEKAYPDLQLTSNSLDDILGKCRFEKIKKFGEAEIGNAILSKMETIDSGMQADIRIWANTLRHRKKVEYNELSNKSHPIAVGGTFNIKEKDGKKIINIDMGKYNSAHTIRFLNISDVINRLISFHKEIIPITNDIVQIIKI